MNKTFAWKRMISCRLGQLFLGSNQSLCRRSNELLMIRGGKKRILRAVCFKSIIERPYSVVSVPKDGFNKAFDGRLLPLASGMTQLTSLHPIKGILVVKRSLYNQKDHAAFGKNKIQWKGLLLKFLKRLCLLTGATVWIVLIIALVMIDDVIVRKADHDLSMDQESLLRTLKFYGVLKNTHWADVDGATKSGDAEAVSEEIKSKESALQSIWQKLKNEEGLRLRFGEIVHICGYKCGDANYNECQSSNDRDNNSWTANCFIEGINGKVGVLSIMFERENTFAEWVATKIHLEVVKESGDIICNISGQLPNGLRNFTRFSDV